MRRLRSASGRLASALYPCVVAAALLSCGDDSAPLQTRVVLASDQAVVTVDLDPFVLRIASPSGRVVLSTLPGGTTDAYGAPAATTDAPAFAAQALPGWDGYVSGEGPWLRSAAATVREATADAATFDFAGPGLALSLRVVVAGPRVRLALDATQGAHAGEGGAAAPGAGLDKTGLSFVLPEDERFFGLGERFATMDHRGWSMYSWAEEGGLGMGEDVPPGPKNPFPNGPSMTYFPVPVLLSNRGYLMHLDTTFRSETHLGSERPDAFRVAVNAGRFAATVYVRESPLDAIADYTEDTGRPPIPAQWVFGPRRRVGRGDVVQGVPEWQLMRQKKVPVTGIDDAVHFLPALSQLGVEDDLAKWTSALHAAGYKAHAYNNPYVAESAESAAADYAYGVENGYFIVGPDGEPALTELISGKLLTLATIDLTNPDAVAWFQDLLRRTLDLGYDGWMHDFGEYVPRDAVLFDGRRGDEVHNHFPVLSAKAAHDLLEEERPGDYLFFVRSGYSGTQRYVPAVWGGDAEATFDETQGLPSAVRGGLNLSMSGVPYWGSDMTGFKCITSAPNDKEVFLRWVELAAVSPVMMEQDACANPVQKKSKWTLWSDEETTQIYAEHARLHTRLQPYFLVLAREAHASGRPLTLHPFLLHPAEPEALAVDDTFYLGPALYAAPVVRRGQVEKETWLPEGRFVDLADYRAYDGGQVVRVPAPLGKLPLFLVAGQILPLLDPEIDTLAPASDPDVVTLDDVADRLDVVVALPAEGEARLTLADGTELEAVRAAGDAGNPGGLSEVAEGEIAACSACFHASQQGEVDRLRVTTAKAGSSDETLSDVRLSVRDGPSRRVRWDVLRLR